jgi:preprotein translocase subunit SecD
MATKEAQQQFIEAGKRRGEDYEWFELACEVKPNLITRERNGKTYILLHKTPEKVMLMGMGWDVLKTFPATDPAGNRIVAWELNQPGGNRMSELTSANTGSPLGILLDDHVLAIPTIRETVSNHGIIIEGSKGFTEAEVARICASLNP